MDHDIHQTALPYVEYETNLNGRHPEHSTSAPPPDPLNSASPPENSVAAPSGPVVEKNVATAQKRKASRAAAAYPRKRATKACLTCRFRRTKCDNARPACAACARLGAECTYQETDLSSFDPASLAILKRLDDIEGQLVQERTEGTRLAPTTLPSSLESPTLPLGPHSDLGSCIFDIWTRRRRSVVSAEAVLQWPPFRDCGFPSRLYPSLRSDDEQASSNPTAWHGSVDIDLPAAEIVHRAFFDNVHIFNPILEEEVVQGYIKRVRFEGIGWDAVSCLVLLIYAHGSIATSFVEATADNPVVSSGFRQSPVFLQAESYFLAAQKRMGMLLCRSGVIDAQCFFLAGVYLMATLRPVEAWKMFVQALACCQGFSIEQQDMDGNPVEDGLSPQQRIYWTCFKSELELRLELYSSQKGVWDLSYPPFFPSLPEALKSKDEPAWYFYLAEIALMRLKSRVLSCLYRPDTAAALESSMEYAILDFEEQIDAWLRSLPKPLELDDIASNREQRDALRYILHGHLLDCQEVMYWQFLVDTIHGRPHRGYYAELFLRKGLKVCVDRIRQNREGFYHRHHGTWLMLRSCSRSSFVLLAAVRCAELAPYLPADWDEAVMDVAKMLVFWKDESTDVCEMLRILEELLGTRTAG